MHASARLVHIVSVKSRISITTSDLITRHIFVWLLQALKPHVYFLHVDIFSQSNHPLAVKWLAHGGNQISNGLLSLTFAFQPVGL